jgi:Protein of unknown function (DUF3443)
VRSYLVLVLVGTLGFLAGCSSNGTPVGVATSITLTPSSASVDAGQSVNITASVANDSSGKGVSWSLAGAGTLSNQTSTGVTYTAPNPVTAVSLPAVVATSIDTPSITGSTPIVIAPAGTVANVAPISVNGGPLAPATIYPNGAFISVLLCGPSNGACQTINNILVDTGSYGLRVLGSQLTSQVAAGLVPLTSNGNTLYNCVSFLDGSFLWGIVDVANLVVGAELAASTSVQVIANPSFGIPGSCSDNGTGTNEDTQSTLGANGILGVGPEPFDCGLACDPSAGGTAPAVYYLCGSGGGCNTTFVSCGPLCSDSSPNQQVTNPVFNFPTDNNGVILVLPAVNDVAATVDGNMVIGIGTESNNAIPPSATILNLSSDNFITNFAGEALASSFIDSGSNGYFFPQINNTPNICSDDDTWYCPASTTPFNATNVGASGSPENTVDFSVDNFDNVMAAYPGDAAFANLAGPQGIGTCSTNSMACSFDWGLPFFYGRSVFTAIDGTTVGTTPTPFFAY